MKKIRCNSNPADFLAVSVFAGCVYIDAQQGDESTEIELSPDKIRKLRKQLKRALIEIEGERPETPTEDNWFSKGKLVKVVANNNSHEFPIGENVKIVSGIEKDIHVFAKAEYLGGHDFWWVRKDDCEPVA